VDPNLFLPQAVFEEQSRAQSLTKTRPAAFPEDAEDAYWGPGDLRISNHLTFCPSRKEVSPWSRSAAKRLFDCACVLLALPVLVPMLLVIAVAVRLTSRGPILFMQERMGRHGRTFTIFKFRSMVHVAEKAHHPITTSDNQCFTPIGPFLRRWKLDELPQIANVLFGHMSLVGPRPKLPEHVTFDLPCRPGITGMATVLFACEEDLLASLPKGQLDAFYHAVVIPAKRKLDAGYMASATFFSDFRLLVNTLLRRWSTDALENFIAASKFQGDREMTPARASGSSSPGLRISNSLSTNQSAEAEQVSAS
jgi:lipopolysaccharide/colanic/teichoic acid biosynthesis glycosyltransferase